MMTELTRTTVSELALHYGITEADVFDTYHNGNYSDSDDDVFHAELAEAAFERRVTDHYVPGY